MNDQADYLSKVIDHEDWTVKDVYFQERFPVRDYARLIVLLIVITLRPRGFTRNIVTLAH